jgi:hypothetical protein
MHRVLTQLNQQASPFKDDETRDSVFTRQMLDVYRDAEAIKNFATHKKAKLYDSEVLSFLKTMEVGPKHPDAVTLKKVNDGELKKDSKAMHDYLVRRLNDVPHLL